MSNDTHVVCAVGWVVCCYDSLPAVCLLLHAAGGVRALAKPAWEDSNTSGAAASQAAAAPQPALITCRA
jgi:hypothetical protein